MNILTKLAIWHLRKTGWSYIINCKFYGGVTIETDKNIRFYDSGFNKDTYIVSNRGKNLLTDVLEKQFKRETD